MLAASIIFMPPMTMFMSTPIPIGPFILMGTRIIPSISLPHGMPFGG
jgi:hypothetical protein